MSTPPKKITSPVPLQRKFDTDNPKIIAELIYWESVRTHLERLGESLVDEDDWDENGEALLGEAGDVADEEAKVEGNDDQQNDHHPCADPEPKRQKVQPVLPEITVAKSRSLFLVPVRYIAN